MILPRWWKQRTTKPVPAFWLQYKLLLQGQRHCIHILLWLWNWFTKANLTGVHTPTHPPTSPRHPTPFKQARSNQRSLSSGKQGAAKTSCQTGKEDKMVTSVPSGNLLFSPGCSTEPRLRSLQETLLSPTASRLLCYPPPHTSSTRLGQCVALAMYRDHKVAGATEHPPDDLPHSLPV